MVKTQKPMRLTTVLLPEIYLDGLDYLVRINAYPSRSAAMRMGIMKLLSKEVWEKRNR